MESLSQHRDEHGHIAAIANHQQCPEAGASAPIIVGGYVASVGTRLGLRTRVAKRQQFADVDIRCAAAARLAREAETCTV